MTALVSEPPASTEPVADLDREIAAVLISREARAPRSISPEPSPATSLLPDVRTSIDTVRRARAEVDAILSRNQTLEAYVAEANQKVRQETKEARETAERWKTRANAAEALLREIRQAASAWETRATIAERELQRGKQALLVLHKSIAATFGYGSTLHERLRAADPNVPGLGVLQSRVEQLGSALDSVSDDLEAQASDSDAAEVIDRAA